MPARGEFSQQKSLQQVRQNENSIEEVNALVTHLKERRVAKEWLFEILADVLAQDTINVLLFDHRDIFQEHKDAITLHGLRFARDGCTISRTRNWTVLL